MTGIGFPMGGRGLLMQAVFAADNARQILTSGMEKRLAPTR